MTCDRLLTAVPGQLQGITIENQVLLEHRFERLAALSNALMLSSPVISTAFHTNPAGPAS